MYDDLKKWCQGVGWDKWAHALVFAAVAALLLRCGVAVIEVVAVCACLGMCKELLDMVRGGEIDWIDLIWDVVGMLIGLL